MYLHLITLVYNNRGEMFNLYLSESLLFQDKTIVFLMKKP